MIEEPHIGRDRSLTEDVDSGLRFLETNTGQIKYRLGGGEWYFAVAENQDAARLEHAISGFRHGGASFGVALQALIQMAIKKHGYTVDNEVPSKIKGYRDKIITLTPRIR